MHVNSEPRVLMDAAALAEKVEDLAAALADSVHDPARTAIVGIRTRGITLARRIRAIFAGRRQWELPLGQLDITLYRDDLSQKSSNPMVGRTELDFDVEDKTLLLIDDVIYSGRTVRSALDELVDFGRPKAILLGVLVDRGWREYPIQPDVAAFKVETASDQIVKVALVEDDGCDEVLLVDRRSV